MVFIAALTFTQSNFVPVHVYTFVSDIIYALRLFSDENEIYLLATCYVYMDP